MPDTKHRVRLFKRDRKLNICYIFSCDNSCNLDVVETLLSGLKEKHGIAILAFRSHFSLAQSSEICESIIPDLQVDFAIFVVHASENRLSINEDFDGIGYARIYRALLKATGDRVIVVITGDKNYKNSAEEQSVVLSRWAWGKMSSQFNVEFLDGKKSFIFSWDKEHRPIHEEAMMHFLDPEKKGERFVPQPNVELTVVAEDPKKTGKSQVNETTNLRAKTEESSFDIQTRTSLAQKIQTRRKQENVSVQSPQRQHQTEEDKNFSEESYIDVSLNDVPMEGYLNKAAAARQQNVQAVDTSASSLREGVAILYRDQTDIGEIKDVFGDVLQRISLSTSDDPSSLKNKLLAQSVRSCFIIVETIKMREELHMKTHSTPYLDLLKTASSTVGRKVVVILCNRGSDISTSEEEAITGRIEELLVEKGLIFWWKEAKNGPQTKLPMLSRSLLCSDGPESTGKKYAKKGTATQVIHLINPEKLILQTRLRHGRISYDSNDVKVRLEEWKVPREVVNNLFEKFQSIVNAELVVYREIETGKVRTVVTKDMEGQFSKLSDTVKGGLQTAASYIFHYVAGSDPSPSKDELYLLD